MSFVVKFEANFRKSLDLQGRIRVAHRVFLKVQLWPDAGVLTVEQLSCN